MSTLKFSALILTLATAELGCGTSVNMRATELVPQGLAPIRTIAVAPLESLTQDAAASAALTSALINELRRRQSFEVIEIEQSVAGVTERWTAAHLAEEVKADAVLVGLVTTFAYRTSSRRSGTTTSPNIGVDVRLVAAGTGEVIWAAGLDAKRAQLLSYDGVPIDELAQSVAERIADEIVGLGAGG